MSLRTRLFLLFGSLLLAMLAAAWWGAQWLTRDLTAELDRVAVSVGRSVVDVISEEHIGLHQNPEPVEVIVERVIRQGDNTIRASHVQRNGRITDLSVQMNEQQIQVFRLPSPPDFRMPITIELAGRIDQALNGPGQLQVFTSRDSREIPIPGEGVQESLDAFSQRLLLGLLGLFALGLIFAAWLAHRVSAPLRQLSAAADRIGRGELGVQSQAQGVSEVNAAVGAFNQMSRQLEYLEEARQSRHARLHLAEIGEIARGLAHSLRNPLNAIGLILDEMAAKSSKGQTGGHIGNPVRNHIKSLDGSSGERGENDFEYDSKGDSQESPNDNLNESQALANEARAQIERIDQSIRNFLTLASSGNAEPQKIDLGALVRDVALEASQRSVNGVEVTIAADEHIALLAVHTEARAMLQALIVNAIEASPAAGVVEITLTWLESDSIEAHKNAVEVIVADRGPGLDANMQERLFQPHATTKPDGSGMGLYLTQRLASYCYGGYLQLVPRDNGGLLAKLRLGGRVNAPFEKEPAVGGKESAGNAQ